MVKISGETGNRPNIKKWDIFHPARGISAFRNDQFLFVEVFDTICSRYVAKRDNLEGVGVVIIDNTAF